MSRTGARLAAFGALIATSGALGVVVVRSPAERADPVRAVSVDGLTDEAEAVRRQLERLRPGRSGRPAQRAVRSAMDAAEALRDEVGETVEERTLNALERELEYLDAVGSVLSNPRSTLASEVRERGLRARAALAAAPGGQAAAAATRGWEDLLAYARSRRGR